MTTDRIMTLRMGALDITKFGRTTLRIIVLSMMTLCIVILSTTTISQAYLDKVSNKQSSLFCFRSCDKKV
jgi:hypothetical protein